MESSVELETLAPYWLAPHVHLGLCDQHAVLMDVRRNRYVAVQPAERLAGWVAGWPPQGAPAGAQRSGAPAVLARLLEQDVLVSTRRTGHPATLAQTAEPERTLLEFDFDRRPAPCSLDLWRMARASIGARASLKLRSMHAVLERVRLRRVGRDVPEEPFDWERARALVRVFVHLRPLFYTARDACLLDSLALLRFLAANGVYAEWVFGVRTAPFRAHCWVQHGAVVFNDRPDRVRQYSPILRV